MSLFDLDFSVVEARVLALTDGKPLDIYTTEACEIFHTNAPTQEQRLRVKARNYRLMYGSDPFFWF